MKASRKACCCCSANGSRVGWRMAPVWIPPVTVKLEPSAAFPSAPFERAETGARPLRAAILVALCASAALPIIKATRPIPHPSLVMPPLLRGLACLTGCRPILSRHQARGDGQAASWRLSGTIRVRVRGRKLYLQHQEFHGGNLNFLAGASLER